MALILEGSGTDSFILLTLPHW